MKMKWKIGGGIVLAIILALGTRQAVIGKAAAAQAQKLATGVPIYEVDPFWPKAVTTGGNLIFGSVGGVAIDRTNDHVWVLNRVGSLAKDEVMATNDPPEMDCCKPVPYVTEFDPAGDIMQSWGGPGQGYDWPKTLHGIDIDYTGNVWIGGNGDTDGQLLKFTKAGKFLMQIGHPVAPKATIGKGASNDVTTFNKNTSSFVYQKTNEVFVSDGYVNRRLIVFDAETGKYHRHWGAYGNKPDDSASITRTFNGDPPQQFNLSHRVLISNDDIVYLADRQNNRVQMFTPDGKFIRELFVAREVRSDTGTACDIAFSADKEQQFLYVQGGDQHIRIYNRKTLQLLGMIGREGHYPGQFYHLQMIAVDTKGSIYTAENTGKRVQKFVFKGFAPASTP